MTLADLAKKYPSMLWILLRNRKRWLQIEMALTEGNQQSAKVESTAMNSMSV